MHLTIRLLGLLISLIVIGASCRDEAEIQVPETPTEEEPLHFLALGDSYTIGQGVAENDRWPTQVGQLLSDEEVMIDSLRIIAQTGWTTQILKTAIASVQPLGEFDLVSLLIGVNDQFQGGTAEEYAPHFEELLDISIELGGGAENVLVVSIPDHGVTPFGENNSEEIAEGIDAFNEVAEGICTAQGIPFVDITTISRSLGASEGALASDDLHPSGEQYAVWAEVILPVALDILD